MLIYKKKIGSIKLKIYSGKAAPTPPVGPALGQKGLNITKFCKDFNHETSSLNSNHLLPVLINYYSDKSYDFFLKKPTINFYFKNLFINNSNNVINFLDILEIVRFKISDFNTLNLYSSIKIILGVFKSMNIFLNF